MKSNFARMLIALSMLAPTSAAHAKPSESAAGQEVIVELYKASDKIEFKLSGKQPIKKLSLRWVQSPRRLRLTIPGAHLSSKSGRVPIDRGVIQWAEAVDSGDGVVIDLATLSNPRSRFSMTPDHRSVNWTASVNEIAKGDELPTLPSGLANAPAEAPRGRNVKPNDPKPALAVKPPIVKPNDPKPALAVKPPTVKPALAVKPTPTRPPVTVVKEIPKETVPKAPKAAERLVSVSANGDLRTALENLAKAAGLQAEIDPGVQGSVSMSFQDVPLNKAVSSILGQQATLYDYKITDKVLKVTSSDGPGVPVTVSNARMASEYFPIKDKKAMDIVEAVRKAVPSLTYTVDERLNQILAEGEPSELERLRKLLQKVSIK